MIKILSFLGVCILLIVVIFSYLVGGQVVFFMKNLTSYDDKIAFSLNEKKCENISSDQVDLYLSMSLNDIYFREHEYNPKNLYFSLNGLVFKFLVKIFIPKDRLMEKYSIACSKLNQN